MRAQESGLQTSDATGGVAVFDPEAARDAQRAREFRDEYKRLLTPVPWSHVATLTFKDSRDALGAAGRFHDWRRHVERSAQQWVPWFYAIERGEEHGRLHIHALLGYPAHAREELLTESWRLGRAEIELFRPDDDAAAVGYVTKSLAELDAEYDLCRRLLRDSAGWRSSWKRT